MAASMKLYYNPGACSMAPHIALREARVRFAIERVDLETQRTESGADFRKIATKGAVPALVLENGQLLTEGAAILQYIADNAQGSNLAPPAGTFERYRLQEWLNYLASEIHRGFTPLFSSKAPDAWKRVVMIALEARFEYLTAHLKDRAFLMGETFSVADCYLFTLLRWPLYVGFNLEPWPVLRAYHLRINDRQMVQEAMAAEGLRGPLT